MSPNPDANREIEAKFSITLPQAAQRLRTADQLVAGFDLGDSSQVEDVDTYYDTAEYLLLRNGHTLRVRCHTAQGEGKAIVGYKNIDLKTPRGLHARTEVEAHAPDLAASPLVPQRTDLPEAVADALAAAGVSGEQLQAICQLVQQRTKRIVLRAGDTTQVFGELSIDDVHVLQPPLTDGGQWAGVGSFIEAELELVNGASVEDDAHEELRTIAGELRAVDGIAPNWQNKMQQALTMIADAQMPAALAEAGRQHMGELCRRIWRQQFVELLLNEAGVRGSDDIEYVHAMRVATRRARAASRLYATWFDTQHSRLARFARRLRATGRALGRVRDLDVALENLESTATEDVTGEDDSGKDKPATLARRWKKQRAKAHRKLVKWLDSRDYATFITEFGAFSSTPGAGITLQPPAAGEAPAPVQVRHALPSMIWTRFEAVRAFEALFEAAEQSPVPVETLHALRIECKYLRYHLEFAAPVLGNEGGELINAIKALQEQLGKLNDAAVATVLIGKANARDSKTSSDAYLARQTDLIEALRVQVPLAFAAFVAQPNRLRLARALAEL